MIFAVSSDAEASGLDCRKTQSDGFSKRGGVYVWDPILVTNPPIREVQALTRDISVREWGVVGSEPKVNRSRHGRSWLATRQ